MSYNLATGLSAHRWSFAQLADVGICCNGHDPNQLLDLRTGQFKTFGMAAPGAGATATAGAAGNVAGDVAYRVRWRDASTGTNSLASALFQCAAAPSNQQVTVDITALSPPARASHWILERTTDGGRVYYPVNYTSSTPNGTVVATKTFVDNLSDSTVGSRTSLQNNQGQPARYRIAWVNKRVLRMAGGRVHRPNCSCANGSPNVTSTDGEFTTDMVGQDFSFDDDTDGKTYEILAYVSADAITLAENYAGATKSAAAASISGPRDYGAWSEQGRGESWGIAEVGALSNILRYGDDGEEITAGIGLGEAGDLICKATRMFLHSYSLNPQLLSKGGDGRIIAVSGGRGACSPKSVCLVDGAAYGMDVYGVWRLSPGGQPDEIGGPLQRDWRGLNFAQADNFWCEYVSTYRQVWFAVCEGSDTYPKKAYVWDLDRQVWIKTKPWFVGRTCGVSLPDGNGQQRLLAYSAPSGAASAYGWFEEIGTSAGAPPATSPLVGLVDSGGANTITDNDATWPTSGEGLDGVPVTLIRAADGSEETQLITANTGTSLTTNTFAGTAPTAGDTYVIGPINATWKTGRLNAGDPTRKKKWKRAYVWLKDDASAVDINARAYYDGSATAYSDQDAVDEDGIIRAASTAPTILDMSDLQGRYYVPLHNKWATDIQLEFYSIKSGAAYQIQAVRIEYEYDGKRDPSRT